jgi:hypothetical protein
MECVRGLQNQNHYRRGAYSFLSSNGVAPKQPGKQCPSGWIAQTEGWLGRCRDKRGDWCFGPTSFEEARRETKNWVLGLPVGGRADEWFATNPAAELNQLQTILQQRRPMLLVNHFINEDINESLCTQTTKIKINRRELKEVNAFTGRNAGKPVPSGPVADRNDPKVIRSVAQDPVALANSNGRNLAKGH